MAAFVEYLQDHGHPGLRIDRWPDDENRDTPEIDAIAGPFAIEHTSIDTLPNQRRDDDWFTRVVGGLKEELSPLLDFRISVGLEWTAIDRGQDWNGIRHALRRWVLTCAAEAPDGYSVLEDIPNVPFPLHVWKQSHRPPCALFGRLKPEDESLPERIGTQLRGKASKLGRYRQRGKTTILLVESTDWVLMNATKMFKAMRIAFPAGLPPGVDQVWYVDSFPNGSVYFWDFTTELAASPSR
ncbi:MAG: hypothetical protein O7H41_11450 [Planctomycetota bacterium]|nr:hypothetical protein [Planctomycetota bacterium]